MGTAEKSAVKVFSCKGDNEYFVAMRCAYASTLFRSVVPVWRPYNACTWHATTNRQRMDLADVSEPLVVKQLVAVNSNVACCSSCYTCPDAR